MKHLAAPFPSFLRRLAVLALVYGLCATAAHAQPTVTAPAISNLGANQVTLTLRSSATGTGYFTLLTGSETAGTPAQTAAGQILGGAAAFRHGSLPLTAATNGTYTVRNLSSNTHYTVCFTAADTTPTLAAGVDASVSFTTTAATNLTGMDWSFVGTPGFSTDQVEFMKLAFAPDGTPYVAYSDMNNDKKATVMRFNGTAWETVGAAHFSPGRAWFLSLAFAPNGTPYVAFADGANSGMATVMDFNGTAWEPVGTAGFSAGGINTPSLAFAPDGSPCVAYMDNANSDKATVMKFNGTAWIPVGPAGFSADSVAATSLAFAPDGSACVAYEDNANNSKATVMQFNGTAWELVGAAGFSAAGADTTSLAIAPDGKLYVLYGDRVDGKATVMTFNGSAWVAVGAAGFTPGTADYTSLAIAPNGTPYVAFRNGQLNNHATVMKYNGSSWVLTGSANSSSVSSDYTSLAFAPDGTPYLAYAGNRATVRKLLAPSTYTVNNTNDDGAGSLREGIRVVPSGSTIHFDSSLSGQTITLASPLIILQNLTIDASGPAAHVKISGAGATGAFSISPEITVTLAHLDIIDGTGLNFFIGPSGGAILSLGNLTMQDCNLSGNSAETGGAICNYQGNLTMQGCSLSGNAARDGGAICNVQGNLTMQDCSLSGNAVVSGGGGIANLGTLIMRSCTLLGNQALIGGGIASMGPMTLQNCTLSGNQATGTDPGDGGGAIFQFGDTVLEHCTIVGNTAAGPNEATSGIFILNGTLTLNNSIVANNGAGGTDNFSVTGGTFTSLGYNLSNDWNGRATTTGDLTANPLLGALANNGGPTRTHALLAGSPAINAADPADATATDQRGALRPQNGRSDIGAYEVVTSIAPTFGTDPTPQTVFSGSTATFTVVASGIPAPTLRWQRNPLGSGSWSDLSDNATYGGTTTNTLTVLSTIGLNTDQFRCVATNSVSFATSAAATLTVHKATPVLTWHQPADLIYGSSLSATQLNASASVAGVFTYDPPAGTVLAVGTEQTLRATFTPADPANCESATVSTIITVHRSAQSIDFPPLPDLTVPPASLTLGASASSGLRVGYSVSGPARLSGNVLTFTGIGEIVVTARQPGNLNYTAAPDIVRRFTVSKLFASVALGHLTATYDGNPHAATATTAPASLTVALTYAGSPTAPTAAGSYAVVATIDDVNYAGEATGTLVIAKAPTSLTWPAPAAIVYGTALSAAQLNTAANVPGVVTYTPAAGTVLHAGSHPLAAAFAPTDAVNYLPAMAQTTLTVTPTPLTVRADDVTITRGSPIPAGTLHFSGWVNADGPAALLNTVVIATTASMSSPAGAYALVPVGGASFDYTITRINGTLTITDPSKPAIVTQPDSQSTTSGSTVTVSVGATGEGLTYQWYRQGLRVPGATSPTLTLPEAGPSATGIYDCVVSGSGSSVLSRPVVVGIMPAADMRTAGEVATRTEWQGITHPKGNVYDQFLLAGDAGTFTAVAGRVARMSFLDENESIVQVEMSGAGSVTVVLANASGPMAPALYNQPGILYMKGKATIVLSGADETTHFTIYSVGTATNPGVTRADVDYAGWADIAAAGIVSTNGGLGGIHQGNAAYSAATGFTGLYAPTVTSVGGLVVVHDIAASASAVPYLYFGPTAAVQVKIAGGSLAQPNNDVLTVSGLAQVQMSGGQDSCGRPAPAQSIRTRLVEDNGTDVTATLATGP